MIIKEKTIEVERVNKKGKVVTVTEKVTLDKSHLGKYSVKAGKETMYCGFNELMAVREFNAI